MPWVVGNRYLYMYEMQNNANIVYWDLKARGWTMNSIAATLGNMQSESTINPGIWQNLIPGPAGGGGWGLVQWTPSTNFTDWADENGYRHDDGYAQLLWIDTRTVPTGQWIPTSAYPMSFDEYKISTESPEILASAFLRNFERPGDIPGTEPIRRRQAAYWYEFLSGEPPDPPDPPIPPWGGYGNKLKMMYYPKLW